MPGRDSENVFDKARAFEIYGWVESFDLKKTGIREWTHH